MASHAAGGDAKAGSVPGQGEAPQKSPRASQRAVWSGHLNRIRRPERPEEGGCKVVTPKHMKKGGVGGCYNPPLGCNN